MLYRPHQSSHGNHSVCEWTLQPPLKLNKFNIMVFLIILISWLIPIIVFGIYAWFNMKPGETLKDFIRREGREVDFMFTLIPVFNLIVLVKLGLELGFNYLLNWKKPWYQKLKGMMHQIFQNTNGLLLENMVQIYVKPF